MIKQLIYFLYFVIFLNNFYFIKTEDCEISGYNWDEVHTFDEVNDTISGEIISLKTKNLESIVIDSSGKETYLDIDFDKEKQQLKILTSEAYKQYEENEIDGNHVTIALSCKCTGVGGKKTITFNQPLIDVNTHPPKFTKDVYEYVLPMPWPKKIDITTLDDIIVNEIDFSNRKIKFEIDDKKYFEISENSYIDTNNISSYKYRPAILRPKINLNLEDDLSLKIYATDEKDKYGNQNTQEAKLLIKVDKEGSVPSAPRFEKLVYEGKYHDTDTIELEELIIDKNTYVESIEIKIEGEYSKNFKIKQVKENKYQLEVKEKLPITVWETETYISLELKIKDETTGTSVILALEGETLPVPAFEKHVYEGIYLESDKIQMENLVIKKETYVESIEFDISGEYKENFKVTNIKDNTYQLEVKTPIPTSVWESEKYIYLELKIKGENTGTVVVLTSELENSISPRFEKHAYEGKYLDNDKIDLEDLLIVKETYVESIEIDMTGKYKENFNLKHTKDNIYQLEVRTPIPSSVWKSEKYISLELEIKGENTGTIVVLTSELENQISPRFEKHAYEGKYLEGDKIDLEELAIVKETYVESIEIDITGKYSKNFNVEHIKDNIYQLEVQTPIPNSVWKSEKYVSLELEIKGENTGTVVVLTSELENQISPRFEKHAYEGKYLEKDKIDLEDLAIVKETYVESIEIDITGKYSKNFNLKHIKDNTYELEVETPIPSTVWKSEKYISLELEIKGENEGTVVVLTSELENQISPRFEKHAYEGKYLDNDDIQLEELVIVKETYVESIKLDITGKYSEYFSVKHTKENKYELEVKKPLPSTVWISENYVSLILEIAGEFTGTTIVLDAEGVIDTAIPRFEKFVYEGKYHDGENIDLEDLVVVEETYVESIEIGINGKYSGNFQVKNIKDNKFKLEVTKPLPSSVWETEKYVSLTLEIKGKNTGSTVVLTSAVEKFEKSVYQGKYYDTDKIDVEDLFIVGENKEVANIEITGEYSENFNVKYAKDNIYQLKIKTPLPKTVWDSEKYISLKLSIKEVYTGSSIALTLEKVNQLPDDCKLTLQFLDPLEERVIISTDFNGEILNKQAVDFPKSKINYSADNKLDFIEIDEDTGSVTIKNNEYIKQGIYEFDVIAENIRKDKSPYKIKLYVQHQSITSKNALSVISIPENKPQSNLIKLDAIDKTQGCKFEVESTVPNGNWFKVNKDTGNIDVDAIDRNDKVFEKMYLEEIQVQLTLKVNCLIEEAETKSIDSFNSTMYGKSFIKRFTLSNDLKNQNNILSYDYAQQDDKENTDYQWIYTNEILHRPEQMTINIRVENTDNHPPSFTDVSPLHVGYPNMEAIEMIHPQFVYQVHAIDQDIGLNGQINYKFESDNTLFIIHQKTGVIYPSKKLSTSESVKIDLKALAVDQDGKGLASAPLPVTVHLLNIKQISVMKIEKGLIENLSEILKEISEKTEWSVRQLTSAVIPEITEHEATTDSSRFLSKLSRAVTGFLTDDNIDTLLTIYTYAFDEDNEVISADGFVKKLKDIEFEGVDWTVDSVEPHSNNVTSIIIKEGQSQGLLIAVIILSIVFVCYIIGSVFFILIKRTNSQSNNLVLTTKPHDKEDYDENITNPRLSVIINDNLIGSSNSDGDTLRVNSGMRERKKSNVTFNDQVQKIELKDSIHQLDSL